MSVTIANSSPPVAIMDLTSDMFPTQFVERIMSWNQCMGASVPTVPWLFPRTPLTPLEWCTACWPSWTCRGWFCYECGIQRGFFHARLPQMAPLEYKHYVVRRVFRFLENPGYSDIFEFNSWNGRWEYLETRNKFRMHTAPDGSRIRWTDFRDSEDGVELMEQFWQDIRARWWLTEMYTLLTGQLHPLPGEFINAQGPGASKHLLSWLLYLRPFLLARPFMPANPPLIHISILFEAT